MFRRNDVKPHAAPPPRPLHASLPSCSGVSLIERTIQTSPFSNASCDVVVHCGSHPNIAQHRSRRLPECTLKKPVCTVASGWGDATSTCKGVPPTPMLISDAAVSEEPTGRYSESGTSSVTRVYPETDPDDGSARARKRGAFPVTKDARGI